MSDKKGNFSVATLLMMVPLIGATAMAIDYSVLSAARERLQKDLDAAAVSALQPLAAGDRMKAMADAMKTMRAQAALTDLYTFGTLSVSQKSTSTLSLDVTASAAPYFGSIFGIGATTLRANADATAGFELNQYYELSIILDKSASMLLAATPADQTKMQALPLTSDFSFGDTSTCVFACHDPKYYGTYQGVRYNTAYDFARAQKVLLRADVQAQAVSGLMDQIDTLDPFHRMIKINIYTIGHDADAWGLYWSLWSGQQDEYPIENGIRRIIGPTSDTRTIRTELSTNPLLTSASSYDTSDFRALAKLPNQMSAAGDGTSPSKPKKAVILITDGMQSNVDWVFGRPDRITPLNPAWCTPVKNLGAKFAVLFTEYTTLRGNMFYDSTLGDTMASSEYKETWRGVMPSPPSMTRAAFLPRALAACASSPDLFQSAAAPDDIKKALLTLLDKSIGEATPRLSQ